MFLTVHAVCGALIGEKITNNLIAFLLGFASHFILDFIPHGDQDLERKANGKKIISKKFYFFATLDLIFLSFFLFRLFKNEFILLNQPSVIFGAIGATIPDFFTFSLRVIYTNFFPNSVFFKKLLYAHDFFHFPLPYHVGLTQGIIIQMVFLILILILLEV